MCMAKDYSDQLLNIYNSIEDSFKDLSDKLSKIDIEEQKLLHEIENSNFDAYRGYLFSRQLKEVRVQRRKIKNELHPLINLRNNYLQKNNNLLQTVHNNIIKQENNAVNFKPYRAEPKHSSTEQVKNTPLNMRLKKSGRKIISWTPLEDGTCCVTLLNGVRNIVKMNNIIDFDESKKITIQ